MKRSTEDPRPRRAITEASPQEVQGVEQNTLELALLAAEIRFVTLLPNPPQFAAFPPAPAKLAVVARLLLVVGAALEDTDALYFERDEKLASFWCETGEYHGTTEATHTALCLSLTGSQGKRIKRQMYYRTSDNSLRELLILSMATAEDVVDLLKHFLTREEIVTKAVWYSGHGMPHTGDWCLCDSELTYEEWNDVIMERQHTENCDFLVNSCWSHIWQKHWHNTVPRPAFLEWYKRLKRIEAAIDARELFGGGGEQLLRAKGILLHGTAPPDAPWLSIHGHFVEAISERMRHGDSQGAAALQQRIRRYLEEFQRRLQRPILQTILEQYRQAPQLKFLAAGHTNDIFKAMSKFEVIMFPAQDGNCSLVRLASSDSSKVSWILLDGGRAGSFRRFTWPVLKRLPAVDLVILTHYDADHITGLLLFFNAKLEKRNTPPVINAVWMASEGFFPVHRGSAQSRQLKHFVDTLGISREDPVAGKMRDSQGRIYVFNPPLGLRKKLEENFEAQTEQNAASICVCIQQEQRIAAFTADAKAKGTANDAADMLTRLKSRAVLRNDAHWFDYIDVPHHGSKHNSSKELWTQIRSTVYAVSGNGRQHGGTLDPNPTFQVLCDIVDAYILCERSDQIFILCTYETDSVERLRMYVSNKGKESTVKVQSLQPSGARSAKPGGSCFRIDLAASPITVHCEQYDS